MLENQQSYQKACYDVCSAALNKFSLDANNPKVRSEFLLEAKGFLVFADSRLIMRIHYANSTHFLPLFEILEEKFDDADLIFAVSVMQVKNLITTLKYPGLGIREQEIFQFFDDVLGAALREESKGKVTLKKIITRLFYEAFSLNLSGLLKQS